MRTEQSDVLLECLLLVSRLLGHSTTRDAVTAGLPLHGEMLSPTLFVRAAERLGLHSRLLEQPLERINKHLLPAVLILNDQQACVLVGLDASTENLQVIFPELPDSVVKISSAEMSDRYTGHLLLINERFQFDERTPDVTKSNRGHWFWRSMWDNLPLYKDVLLAAFVINIFALSLPFFTLNVYDRVVPNYAIETLWVLAIGIGIVLMADLTLKSLRAYFLELASKRVDVRVSTQLMAQVLGMRMEFRPLSVGAFSSNLRAFEVVRDFTTSATMITLIDLPFTVVFLLVIAWIGPVLVIPVCLGITVILIYSLKIRGNVQRLSENVFRASSQRNSILIESMVGLDTLKAMAAEGEMQRRWEKSTAFISRLNSQLHTLSASNGYVAAWCQQLVTVSIIVLGVYLIAAGELSLGGLIATTMLSNRAMAPASQVAGLMTQFHNAKSAMTALEDIMSKPVERPDQQQFLSRAHLEGNVQFKNVGFHYPNSKINSLTGINLSIKSGEHVGILGRIGSGKTSFEKLLIKLFQPTEGNILIDGVDLAQVDPAELRRNVGYVPQDVNLIFGSLRENIVLGCPSADDEMVFRAIQISGLEPLVNKHPQGAELPVGERGEFLSGGQRRAVALARALVSCPQVLLLDEITAGMDHSSEQWIKQQLETYAQGKTMILITHSSAMMELVDRLIVLDGGRVVADGPKKQVMAALSKGQVTGDA